MIFNSFDFIWFFVVVLIIVGLAMKLTKSVAIRNVLLLVSSYYFYGSFKMSFLVVLVLITLINYIGAIVIDRYKTQSYKKAVTTAVVILSLLPLVFYKYADFIISSLFLLSDGNGCNGWLSSLILPVGISFFTFQSLSYTLDIYRGKIQSSTNFINIALFISFFPTILSGPIEKARNLLPQIEMFNSLKMSNILQGVTIFIWGVFKKVVIADRLSAYVDSAYGGIDSASGATLALAAFLYSIQIYCDFSGYSDMALGVAKCFGFNITQNFRHPYFAKTIKDFWNRWHISLTSWFTEYFYYSLGGNRVRNKMRWVFNISMVFLLSGIWHGASWNFIIWGLLHAIYYLVEHMLGLQHKDRVMKKGWSILSGLVVFFLVTIAWIFFRIEDFHTACYVVKKIFTPWAAGVSVGASTFTFALNMILVLIFFVYDWMVAKDMFKLDNSQSNSFPTLKTLWVITLLILISMFSVSSNNFVYFQF